MDEIIVGIILLGAVAYLFWRFRSTIKKKDTSCGCASCGSGCGSANTECVSTHPLIIQGCNGMKYKTGNR